jgi:GTP-binding protein
MTQTKFVLKKALSSGLRPVVVLNKMDRPNARAEETETTLFDLFTSLNATDEQLDYPTLYASAKDGWAVRNMADDHEQGVAPLLDTFIERIPPPTIAPGPFSMLITNLESDQFLGRIVVGRVLSGSVKVGDPIHCLSPDGTVVETATVYKVTARRGLDRIVIDEGVAGDIVGVSGFTKANATMTVCAPEIKTPIPTRPIDPPVLSMMFQVNKGPFAGKEGTLVVGRKILQRLDKELESNVSMAMERTDSEDTFIVKGRGELQLGILLENMRREGFELCVSQPRILMKRGDDGKLVEPIEEVHIEVDNENSGWVIEKLTKRLGKLDSMIQEEDKVKIIFYVPSRGLLGFRSEFMNETHGSGLISHAFHSFEPYKGAMDVKERGCLTSCIDGTVTAYALEGLQARGIMYVTPGTKVYTGMIIGINNKEEDLDVNPVREKHLTNVRTVMKEDQLKLLPPRILTLEDALALVKEDELVEITPKSIRLRKKELDQKERQRMAKRQRQEDDILIQ